MEVPTLERLFRTRWTGGQYAFVRVTVALSLAAWSAAALSTGGALHVLLGLAGLALSVLVLLGWRGPEAAAVAALLITASGPFLDPALRAAAAPAVLVLVLHLLTPRAPYGTVEAARRVDPRGHWRLPPGVYALAWAALVLQIPEGRWPAAPPPPSWWIMVVAIAALVPWRRFRPWLWLALFVVQAVHPMAGWTLPLAALYLFTFDPGWIPPRRTRRPVQVLYDGECRICQGWTRFLVAEDLRHVFRFAPLQGPTANRLLTDRIRERYPESVLVRLASGEVMAYSRGALYVLDCLGGIWRVLAILARLFPLAFRDRCYSFAAAMRQRFTSPADTACPVLPRRLASRFDP